MEVLEELGEGAKLGNKIQGSRQAWKALQAVQMLGESEMIHLELRS